MENEEKIITEEIEETAVEEAVDAAEPEEEAAVEVAPEDDGKSEVESWNCLRTVSDSCVSTIS